MKYTPRIPIDRQRIEAFCRAWQIVEFALFGSVLRDDFGPQSDVDVLVTFAPTARVGLFDLQRIEGELCTMFGRPVDLVERMSVERSENYLRRSDVLQRLEPIYAAR